MDEKIMSFISNCAASKLGRLLFVAYLIYLISMVTHAWGNIPYSVYPFRFYGERELFELLNWPQLELLRTSRRIFRLQGASQVSDTAAAVYIAMPWWIYGYLFQSIVKRIADTAPRNVVADYEITSPEGWPLPAGDRARPDSSGIFCRLRSSLSSARLR